MLEDGYKLYLQLQEFKKNDQKFEDEISLYPMFVQQPERIEI